MENKDWGTLIKIRRRQITLSYFSNNMQSKSDVKVRSKCGGWNEGTANRLGNYIDNFRDDFCSFGTLTYPDIFPSDGSEIKGHWRAFIERLRRTGWLVDGGIVWWLEFQERGAPHFHFLATKRIAHEWLARVWSEITGGNEKSCTSIEAIKNPSSMGNYAKKYAMKSEQKAVPSGFKNIGRMWGVSAPKILRGQRRVPVMTADIVGAPPASLAEKIGACRRLFGVRVGENERGYTIYGTEEGIKSSWRYLRESIAQSDRGGRIHVATRRGIVAESLGMRERRENRTRLFAVRYTSKAASNAETATVRG